MAARDKNKPIQEQIEAIRAILRQKAKEKPGFEDDPAVRELYEDLDFAEQHFEVGEEARAESCLEDADKLLEELGISEGA